jgi:pyruvate dehydrogenase E2 component (dihydrolipoamide acetyltransferase)
MARLLRIPEISAGATEAVLASWPLAENVPYSAADVIASVETDKAVIDIEAEEDGVILRRLVVEGASVAVGQPIALLGVLGEVGGDIEEMLRAHGLPAGGPASASGAAATAGTVRASTVPTNTVPASTGVTGNGPGPAIAPHETGRIFVSPLARRLAREGELDLTVVAGTGPNGRIMRRDVEQAIRAASSVLGATAPESTTTATAPESTAAAPAATATATAPESTAAAPAATTATGPARAGRLAGLAAPSAPASRPPVASPAPARYTAVPHSRVRQAIASRMTESKQTVPHFYVAGSARADKLVRLRSELNDGPGQARVSVNDLVIKAVGRAHQLVPAMNVIWTPDALLCYEGVDVGVAIASARGLVTPVLRSVEQASVSALAAAVADLADRAAAGRLQQRELEGGTTSVSNLGMFGVEHFSAIINPPQSSIIAVGAVHDVPVVEQGELRVGSVLRVTLSADHRAVDGTTAAEWMKAFVGLIEHPVQILA